MKLETIASNDRSIRRYLFVAALSCMLLVGGAGGLAAVVRVSGAVLAPGTLVVDSYVKKVQHPTGGMVARINVREGDAVKAGDVVLRLEETVTRANLAIVEKGLDEIGVQITRLEAERDGKLEVDFASQFLLQDGSDGEKLISGERSLFELRKQARLGQKAQLKERIAQLGQQVSGLTEQRNAKWDEIDLIDKQLDSVRSLWQQKLVSIDRMTALEREAVRLKGEHGQLSASIAQAKGQVAEIELQIIQVDQNMRSEVAGDLRDAQSRRAELVERKVAAEDALKHIDLRSPQDGVVHQLAVHTVGGVIAAGEPVMLIVPIADRLLAEARIAPKDIDQIVLGQSAKLHLTAFNRQTTPVLDGTVTNIAADLTMDQQTGAGFYNVRVEIPSDQAAKLQKLTLAPGMPVEIFFATGERTFISYLVKPLTDQVERAFREE